MRKNGGGGSVVTLKPLLSALVISGLRMSLHKRVGATKPIIKANTRPIIKTVTRAAKTTSKTAKTAKPKKPVKPAKPTQANKKKMTMKGGARSDFFE